MGKSRHLTTFGLLLLLCGCLTIPTSTNSPGVSVTDDASSCIAKLADESGGARQKLDASDISIVNWNIQKGKHAGWSGDLAEISVDPNLLILQEASPRYAAWNNVAPGHFRSFAEGSGLRQTTTGVMTLSSAPPLTECNLVSHEPWFGTRKATLVTEYGLTHTDRTLLVVNIHGINFTFGVQALKQQLLEAQMIIATHDGPVLFSGDFNTWNGGKERMLEDIVSRIELVPLEYDADHRKRVFGKPLDHIYVRGLDPILATTQDLDTSDHNPMMVRFNLTDRPGSFTAAR